MRYCVQEKVRRPLWGFWRGFKGLERVLGGGRFSNFED